MNTSQDEKLQRIDSKYIIHELEHILHLERGIFYTIKKLLYAPGLTINEFITENRTKITKPIVFLVITSLLYNITNKFAHFQDDSLDKVINNNTVTIIENWCNSNLGYYNIILGLFVAFFLNILFFKTNYTFFEVLVLMCYIIGIDILLAAVTGLFSTLLYFNFMKTYAFVCFIYSSWAIANFYGKNKWYNYIKALVAFILGLILITFFPNILGFLIDLIIK
jgi:Protein of unknown function (DUF3667)